jgi:hypothetical protein
MPRPFLVKTETSTAEHMFSEWPLIGNWIGHAERKASRAAIVAISLVFGAGV